MKVRPLHFVPNVDEALRFYQALGLEQDARRDEPQRLAQRIEEFIQATPIAGQVAGTTLVAD